MESTNMRQLTRRVAALEKAQGTPPALLQQELEALSDDQIDAILRGEAVGRRAIREFVHSLKELSDAELNALIDEG